MTVPRQEDIFRTVRADQDLKLLGSFSEDECEPVDKYAPETNVSPKNNGGLSCFDFQGRHIHHFEGDPNWKALIPSMLSSNNFCYDLSAKVPDIVGPKSYLFFDKKSLELFTAKYKDRVTVSLFICYKLAKDIQLPYGVEIRKDNSATGHHTIYSTQPFRAEKIIINEKPYWVHPDITGLDWRLHCFCMKAAASPKEYESHFDCDSWNAARVLFEHIETFDLDDMERANAILCMLADQNYPSFQNINNSDFLEPLRALPRLLSDIVQYCDADDCDKISHIRELVRP